MSELILAGLDGSNPLGFLAALGVLEATTARGARLAWRDVGVWRPVLISPIEDIDALIVALDADRRACIEDPALSLEYGGTYDLKPPPGVFRGFLERLLADAAPHARRSVDWAAAFATDVAVDNNGNTKPTALHFTAGNQVWLEMVRRLSEEVTPDDLREALVGPWRYERKLPVLSWDATVSRDYALRATNPALEKKAGVPGADWLAVRGLPSLAVVPRGTQVATPGCTGEWKTGRFTWPLWTVPLGLDLVRSTLRLADLDSERVREARGIGIVFESGIRRSDQGGYGTFTPASVV
ncbi:MAG: hypothetical protein IT385_17090 [Deltaproteobacteria bacterium]|nr:hypothetical protein [Deltaproteobacteria bacterium]